MNAPYPPARPPASLYLYPLSLCVDIGLTLDLISYPLIQSPHNPSIRHKSARVRAPLTISQYGQDSATRLYHSMLSRVRGPAGLDERSVRLAGPGVPQARARAPELACACDAHQVGLSYWPRVLNGSSRQRTSPRAGCLRCPALLPQYRTALHTSIALTHLRSLRPAHRLSARRSLSKFTYPHQILVLALYVKQYI